MKKTYLFVLGLIAIFCTYGQNISLLKPKVLLSCAENRVIPYNIEMEKLPNGTIFRLNIQLSDSVHWTEMRMEWDCPMEGGILRKDAKSKDALSNSFFVNGFQSWTESKERYAEENIPDLSKIAKPLMAMYGDYNFAQTKHEKGEIWGWNYGYERFTGDSLLFIASLDEKKGYTQITFDLKGEPTKLEKSKIIVRKELEKAVWKKGDYVAMEILVVNGTEKTCFDTYFTQGKFPKSKLSPQTGWTSWYNYYTNISEAIIKENVAAFAQAKTPIQYVQIDDGWQEGVGDWLRVNEKFPLGMRYLAQTIHRENYKAGLWLAPFICERKSLIFQKHADWILHDEKGKKVKAGFNPGWSGEFYALDFYNPEVRNYLKTVFQTVLEEWEFDMVKLDFLYGVAIIPQKGKSRGEIMWEAMHFLRECCGEKQILGCGVPLNAAMFTTDFCRIGADIGLDWGTMLKAVHNREGVSTEYGIQNAASRHQLNGHGFLNDPDVYNLRSKNNKLTENQKYTLFVTNQVFGGLCFTSDNISEYSAKEKHLYNAQFPFLEKKILSNMASENLHFVHFQIGERKYWAISNLSDKKTSVQMKAFLTESYVLTSDSAQKNLVFGQENFFLEPYQTHVYVQELAQTPSVLFDNLHVFPCSEVEKLSISAKNEIEITFSPNVQNTGIIWVKVPNEGNYLFHNEVITAEEKRKGEYILRLERK